MTLTARGLRNNNPANIIYDPTQTWIGQTGSDGHFAVFDTALHGLRAAALNFYHYQTKHRLRTVRGLIARHAPGFENDTAAYIAFVAAQLGVGPDEAIDLGDPAVLSALLVAVVKEEDGGDPYDAQTIAEAVAEALP